MSEQAHPTTPPPAVLVDTPRSDSSPARGPLVFASPHSGTHYPADFVRDSALDPLTLKRSEDAFVDRLFAGVAGRGCPLLRASYARVYLDVNREPYELDPTMFEDKLPSHINTSSLRVAGGLGTIARVVADGAEVYRSKLTYAEAEQRVEQIYYPYHRALQALLTETWHRFGHCILIDCHSMPSVADGGHGGTAEHGSRRARPDIVLGDRFGTTCAPLLTETLHRAFAGLGYQVARNNPYAGGFTTYNYGRPASGMHAIQIEINRALYMDEARIRPTAGYARLIADLATAVQALLALPAEPFQPTRPAARPA